MIESPQATAARIIDAVRNDPGSGDAREHAIAVLSDLLTSLEAVMEADEQGWPLATAKQIRASARDAIAKAGGVA